jgi:transcriptional regulator with XRE-family HTH domain
MAKHWIYSEAFDRRYREFRERTGASNEDVARALGKSEGTINSYRRKHDAITPDPETLLKAAELFGCNIFEFMPDYRAIQAVRIGVAELTDLDIYRISESARMLTDPGSTQEERDMMVQGLRELQDKIARLKRSRSTT